MFVDVPLERSNHQHITQSLVLIPAQSVEGQLGIHGDYQLPEWVKVQFCQAIMRLTNFQLI